MSDIAAKILNFIRNFKYAVSLFFIIFALAVFCYFSERRQFGYFLVFLFFTNLYIMHRIIFLGRIISLYSSLFLVLITYYVSLFKFDLTARRLHPFDLYQYANYESFIYALDLYKDYRTIAIIGLFATFSVYAVAIYFDGFRRYSKFTIILLASILTADAGVYFASNYMDGNGFGPGNRFLHFNHQHVSTFSLSAIRAFPELMTGQRFDYGPDLRVSEADVALVRENTCTISDLSKAPDILVVLRESAMVPEDQPAMKASFPPFEQFASFDGMVRRMRVETHGAGSAYSIFNILTGISTEAFGGMKTLSVDFARDGDNFTLPKLMKECGYANAAVTTGNEGYVGDRKFYANIGFEHYSDLDDLKKMAGKDSSDRAVYGLVQKTLDELNSEKPVFVYADTTASHYPYRTILRPEDEVPEAKSIRNPEYREYIRRLVIAERDVAAFIQTRERLLASGGRPLVILEFGDHQPPFTTRLPGAAGYVNEDRWTDDPNLVTWFRIRSVGFPLSPIPQDHPLVDAAYVGDWLLRALNFDVGGIYQWRAHIIDKCKSRYWQCNSGNDAYYMHQLMRRAGLLTY